MCGIVGCIGQENVTPFLLEGLRRESYRGYDSSGIAVIGEAAVLVKAVGKLDQLEEKVRRLAPSGLVGIGHNRWATHGTVTEVNAHPHADCTGDFYVVHNGIIENFVELREKMMAKGHTFISATDSEVLAHLIEHFYSSNLETAVIQALQLVKGTYGLVAISKREPQVMVAARMASPLVLSTNGTTGYVASDPAALASHSDRVVFLDDREVATIQAGEYRVTDLNSKVKFKQSQPLEWSGEEESLGAFDHFMQKEIFQQPESLANTLRGRLVMPEGTARLGGLASVAEKLKDIERLNIIACGTAYYAGLVGQYLLEEYAGMVTDVAIASEYRYRSAVVTPNTASLFISQSGETADTLAALEAVKKRGELTLGIVNAIGSSIARETDAGVYNHAGPELGVASTKAFTSQLAVLTLLAVLLGRQRGMTLAHGQQILAHLSNVPTLIERLLADQAEHIRAVARGLVGAQNVLFVGRKFHYPIALEGALKLKEVAYTHAEGYSAGELKHGAIALIDAKVPTIAICPRDSVYDKTISNIQEVKSRSGRVIAVATEGDQAIAQLADAVIYIPATLEPLTPILSVVPLQMLAYYVGLGRGLDVDRPRNLAKSVTVE